MTERPAAATWILAALVFGVETVLLWNVECLRVYRALGAQSKALTGGAVPWSLLEFLGFASGWRSGPSDGGHWLVSLPAIAEALLPLSIGFLAVWPLIRYRRQLQPLLRFAAPIVYVGVCFLGVLYFRNVAASPWPVGVGQTWSEFKLSNWVSPVLLALAGAGVAALGRGSFRATSWICVLVIWTVASIHANSQLAKTRVAEVLRQTGRSHDPFESYREMRTLMFMAKPQETVYLDLGGSAVKSRQFAAYFLHDYPIAADWSDDAYIHPWLPKGWQDVSLTDCGWWLRRIAEANSPPKRGLSFRTGAFELRPSPDFRAVRDTVTGGYGIESDASGWWVWTPDRLEVRFRVRSMLPGEARLRFQYLANRLPRSLIVTTTGGSEARTDTIALAPAWQTWVSASFTVVAEEVVVRFSSPESPVPIGDADSRLAAFLIKNVRLEPSNDSVRALSPR
jgi:hypothetical protein